MALSPELKRMLSVAALDPLEAKRAEILARQADNDDGPKESFLTIRDQLVRLGLKKASKHELLDIIMKYIEERVL